MFIPPAVVVALFLSGLFFLWNFVRRVTFYNFLLITSQNAVFPAELAGMIDSLVKSLGIHAFIYAILYVLSSFSIIQLPMLSIAVFLLSIAVFTWPIFFFRRIVYEGVIKAFKTPDWKDDSITLIDIFWRSAGICQALVWIFTWVSGFFLG